MKAQNFYTIKVQTDSKNKFSKSSLLQVQKCFPHKVKKDPTHKVPEGFLIKDLKDSTLKVQKVSQTRFKRILHARLQKLP